ncbi:class I SAM-dependent methyltransferase [Streptomyces sp. NPDC050400]|uniref:class I SAM-dependent methyltransferase n=1 Tax=Streptomyces sp. NPDC050400 TaxID=3365610 RepID=UPI0037971980
MTDAAADTPGFRLTGSAPERYEQYVAPLMAPFVTALVDGVGLNPGDTVLDLACGTGFVARLAAARVGPTGRVHGADASPDMLGVATAHRPHLYPDIEFTPASADRLPYDDASFDAVLCQQGAQFFPDLVAALTQAARVTRPGGRFAATTWTDLSASPYFLAQHEVITRYAGAEAAAPYTEAFRCTGDVLTEALHKAGFQDATTRTLTLDVTLPPLATHAAGHLSAIPWGVRIAQEHGPEALAEAGRAIADRFTHRTAPDGTVTLPFTATLVTATR